MKFIALALALTLTSPALAQARGITYDCDTAAGHFSELTLPAGVKFDASGKVRLLNMAESEQWAPFVRIVVSNDLESPGPSNEAWAGFTMGNMPQFEDQITALLQTTERAKDESPSEDSLGIASAREVEFGFAYDGQKVEMTVDGHAQSFSFSAERPVLRIVCSTGEFLIHDLVISSNE